MRTHGMSSACEIQLVTSDFAVPEGPSIYACTLKIMDPSSVCTIEGMRLPE